MNFLAIIWFGIEECRECLNCAYTIFISNFSLKKFCKISNRLGCRFKYRLKLKLVGMGFPKDDPSQLLLE